MQIQIKNIWKIKNAIVNLDWLSVIAWNNDTWKTTVSKIVFSVIKALQKYKEFSKISKEEILKGYVEQMYRQTRTTFHFLRQENNKEAGSIFKVLKNEFEPSFFWENFIKSSNKKEFLETKKGLVFDIKFIDEAMWTVIKDDFLKINNKIYKEFKKKETKEYLVEKSLNHIFNSEFKWDLNCGKAKGEILMKDWELELFKITIKKNKAKIKIIDDFIKIKDSTFINSPIILDFFNDSRFINLQYHYEDLFTKINNISLKPKKRKNGLWKKIKDTIKWSFELTDDFVWKKLGFQMEWMEREIEIINTATWIKSFWILDLLDKSNCLDWDDLLILDEPEVHLHPEWQVKYAQLIIDLIQYRDLSVLITSHSPYIIEALSKFSKEKEVKASFYLAEEDWKINDKTDKRYEISEKLAEPFNTLMS